MHNRLVTIFLLGLALVPSARRGVDYSRPEPGEQFPGGGATLLDKPGKDAFSRASANMSFEREMDFKVGNGFFKRLWVSAPAST